MSMATTKPPDLVSCSDQDFNNGIVGLSLKELLGTISILQKEMTREQENFNSLSSELNSLNKNSRQYKQIQKEMTTSQGRLTSLMNRSMKCFQQQGNHHVTRPDRDSPAEEKEITVKDQTDRVPLNSKPTVVVQNGESEKISHSSSVQQQNEQSGKQLSSVIVVGHTQQNGELTKEKSSIVSTKVNVNYPNMAGAGNNVKPNIENKENITHNSNTKLGDTVSRNQSSDVTKPSTFKSSVSVMSVTPRSTVAENSSSALSERSSEQKSDEAKTVVKAPTNVNKTAPPAVVYHMGRPIAVDQNVGQNRDQMMEQIRNFKRKSDTVPDVVKPEDKVKKEVFSSETLNADHTEKKQEKIQTTEAVDDDHDSGAEDGSGEASPEVEKYVSSFSFPQKAKPEPTKVQDINRQEQVTPAVQSHLGMCF